MIGFNHIWLQCSHFQLTACFDVIFQLFNAVLGCQTNLFSYDTTRVARKEPQPQNHIAKLPFHSSHTHDWIANLIKAPTWDLATCSCFSSASKSNFHLCLRLEFHNAIFWLWRLVQPIIAAESAKIFTVLHAKHQTQCFWSWKELGCYFYDIYNYTCIIYYPKK